MQPMQNMNNIPLDLIQFIAAAAMSGGAAFPLGGGGAAPVPPMPQSPPLPAFADAAGPREWAAARAPGVQLLVVQAGSQQLVLPGAPLLRGRKSTAHTGVVRRTNRMRRACVHKAHLPRSCFLCRLLRSIHLKPR